MASIANFGFGEASLRFIALYYNSGDANSIKRIISTSFWTYIVLGSITTITVILLAGPLTGLLNDIKLNSEQAVYLVRISAITFLVRFIFGIFGTIPQAIQRFDISGKIAIFETIGRICLYVTVLLKGFGLKGVVYSELILAVFVTGINIVISSNLLDTSKFFNRPSLSTFKEIFNYSIFSFLTQMIGLLWQYSDRILLGYFIGSAAIAYFSVPQQIIFKILGLIAAASVVLFPRFSTASLDNNSKKLYKEFTLLSLVATIIIFSTLSLVIKDFISLWISPTFANETKNIAVILSVSCMIRGAFPVYENLFKGIGRPEINMYIVIGSSLIIVISDFLLIPHLGLNGAGIAYLLSPLAGVAAILFIWKKILMAPINEIFRNYLMPLLISYFLLLFAFIIKKSFYQEPSWTSIIIQSALFGIIQVLIILAYFRLFARSVWESVLSFKYSVLNLLRVAQ
jgi:O-antigen/teichoic acid export membrane protein